MVSEKRTNQSKRILHLSLLQLLYFILFFYFFYFTIQKCCFCFYSLPIQTSVNSPMQSVMLCCSCLNQELSQGNSSAAKKDRLEYIKFHQKGSKIYRFSHSATQHFLGQATIVANIFEDFETSQKFLGMHLKVHESLLSRIPCVQPCSTCQRAKYVPNFSFLCRNMPKKRARCANYLTKCAKVQKTCQFFDFTYQEANFSLIFPNDFSIFEFFNYAQYLPISRIFGQFQKTYLAKQRI